MFYQIIFTVFVFLFVGCGYKASHQNDTQRLKKLRNHPIVYGTHYFTFSKDDTILATLWIKPIRKNNKEHKKKQILIETLIENGSVIVQPTLKLDGKEPTSRIQVDEKREKLCETRWSLCEIATFPSDTKKVSTLEVALEAIGAKKVKIYPKASYLYLKK